MAGFVSATLVVRYNSMAWTITWSRHSAIPVTDAKNGELIRQDRAYLAPADYHLLVNADRTFSLTQSDKVRHLDRRENLFESAAEGSF